MNLYTNKELDQQTATEIHDDILPDLLTMTSVCSQYGGDGSQIKNLCDGMMTILKEAYSAEMKGEKLDPIKTKQNIQKMGLSYDDDDGIKNENVSISGLVAKKQPEKEEMSDGSVDDLINEITNSGSRTHNSIAAALEELAEYNFQQSFSKFD